MTVFLIALIALLLLFFAALGYCWRRVFWVDRKATMRTNTVPSGEQYQKERDHILSLVRAAQEIPFEAVTIRSHDGLTLCGRYYETAPGAPLQIQFHSYRSNPYRDFAGGLPLALKLNCNVLLISQRGHERSEGNALTFGILERQDCLRWINYAVNRFGGDTPIFLAGVSMGAATVLMASDLPLPENVKGIIADCGYTSPEAIVKQVMADMHYPVGLLYPLVRLSGMVFGHFDLESASAVDSLRRCKVPVLFLHGEDDRFIPCDMTRENYEACAAPKTLVTIPGAGHALSFLVDEAAYEAASRKFLERCLRR